jgi:hypothetical protein
MDELPVVLVSDRASWIQEARLVCRAVGAIPEDETWRSVADRTEPGSALVLDITDPFDQKRDLLERWAKRAWQPLCVLCVRSRRGAAELTSWAGRVGYRYVLHGDALVECRADLETCMLDIIEKYLWLVPEVARALGCHSLSFVEALHAACLMIPDHRTVDHWARERLGLTGRRATEELFAGLKLPEPKAVLDWLRVSKVVAYAAAEGVVTLDRLAPVFGCQSGRYLGLRLRYLTGRSLEQLVGMSAQDLLRLLIANYRRRERSRASRSG